MAQSHDQDQKHIILNGVDDPMVTDAYPIAGPTSRRTGCRGPWVVGKETYGPLDAGTERRIQRARKGAVGQQLSPVESRYARSAIESRDVH
jgi:hypothetical protein